MSGTQQSTFGRTVPGKAIGLINIPDTVNEARIRSLVPENLVLAKVEMRPENSGVILEFHKESVWILQNSLADCR
jgi:Occluded RNA-recognition motif